MDLVEFFKNRELTFEALNSDFCALNELFHMNKKIFLKKSNSRMLFWIPIYYHLTFSRKFTSRVKKKWFSFHSVRKVKAKLILYNNIRDLWIVNFDIPNEGRNG